MEKSDAAKPCSTSDSMGYVYQGEKGYKNKGQPPQ